MKKRDSDCTICVAKTKALISCAVTAQLICVFVFAYARNRFSHDTAHIRLKHNQGGHFSKSILYVNTLLVLIPIIILLSELNSKFQMLSSDI